MSDKATSESPLEDPWKTSSKRCRHARVFFLSHSSREDHFKSDVIQHACVIHNKHGGPVGALLCTIVVVSVVFGLH